MRWRRLLLVAGLASALLVCGTAWAQPGASRTALHVERVGGYALQIREVVGGVEAALRARADLELAVLGELLEPPTAQRRTLAQAEQAAATGRAQLDNLEVVEGVASLQRARQLRESVFPLVAATAEGIAAHAGLLGDLAIAHFLAGEKKRAESALIQSFILAPKLEYDRKKYPPQMKSFFETTRFLVDELGTGAIAVTSVPPGAAVQINGALVGYAPVVAPSVAAGRVLVSVAHPGYATRTRGVVVQPGQPTPVRVVLGELPGGLGAQLRRAAAEGAQRRAALRELPSLARRLGCTSLVVGVATGRDDAVALTLALYDAAAGRVTGRVQGMISVAGAGREARELVAALFAVARRTARDGEHGGPSWPVRFYRSRYFWPVVGGVLGAAAVGAGLGVYFGTRGDGRDRERRFLVF